MINIPKGTKDVVPAEAYKWHYVEEKIREVAREFCIGEIRTPVFEHTELFLRGVGDTTDIVNKEMYTFNDKGGRSITLKPEGTAGVARAFIENGFKRQGNGTAVRQVSKHIVGAGIGIESARRTVSARYVPGRAILQVAQHRGSACGKACLALYVKILPLHGSKKGIGRCSLPYKDAIETHPFRTPQGRGFQIVGTLDNRHAQSLSS